MSVQATCGPDEIQFIQKMDFLDSLNVHLPWASIYEENWAETPLRNSMTFVCDDFALEILDSTSSYHAVKDELTHRIQLFRAWWVTMRFPVHNVIICYAGQR